MALLDVRHLRVRFDTPRGHLHAVKGLSLTIERGETLALVGESGSGKSVTALAMMGLVPHLPGVVETGEVWLDGCDILTLAPESRRALRGKEISLVFQDARSALNPLLSIDQQMREVLQVHLGLKRRAARDRCARALGELGLAEPERLLDAYPHELSGGMCQRVMIAMALLCRPKVLLADEPTTAVDVTVQAQILDRLADLQHRHGTAILLISHDLAVVAGSGDRVLVMYAGRIVEEARTTELFEQPLHPYAAGLLACVPSPRDAPGTRLTSIPGQPPDLLEPSEGCDFAPRCPHVTVECTVRRPFLAGRRDEQGTLLSLSGRRAACLEMDRIALGRELFEDPEAEREDTR